jgi:hypothetical protein
LAGSVIFTPSDVSCCGNALTEEIQIVDAKRIMTVAENTNLSDLTLKVLMYFTGEYFIKKVIVKYLEYNSITYI